ncbi:MAG: (2Fe-2S)-binding protein [Acidobacteria bacterium]|nr:(2Fe-2S)-binding protein [Acidobacteriota bacterium]
MRDDEKKQTGESREQGLSRRKFLKGVGIGGGVLGSGILGAPLLPEEAAAQATPASTQTRIWGPGAVAMQLTFNGQKRSLQLEPRVTLLEALRDTIELTGAKKVCDRASCGACTVILDGHAAYSCSVLAIEAQGKNIQTVEGLAQGGALDPIQAAFVQHDAQQCGFCTSGMVMAAKACVDKYPNPTAEQIRVSMGGNLCRCGTYVGVVKAIQDAAGKRPGNALFHAEGGVHA